MPKYLVTHNETYLVTSVIEADSPEEASEVATFLTEGVLLKSCKYIPEIKNVTISDTEHVIVEEINGTNKQQDQADGFSSLA